MSMLELMYAPADWVTLMVMPTYMDMNMNMQGLLTPAEQAQLPPALEGMYMHHTMHTNETGGIGDTGLYATFKLYDAPSNKLVGTLGFTVPTGDVEIKLRNTHQINAGFNHYMMQ